MAMTGPSSPGKPGPNAAAPTPKPAHAPGVTVVGPQDGGSRRLLYGGIAGGIAIALVVTLLAWQPWKHEPPRMNEEPYRIAKFVVTEDFRKLPFEKQFSYMELLDDKEDALVQAYVERKLTDDEYARALQAAYLGKHMKRARNYAEKSTPRLKEAYLDKLIEKKKKNKAADKAKPESTGTEPLDPEEIKRDDSAEQETIDTWPAEAVAQWTAYRTALKQRKDNLKEKELAESDAKTPAAPKPSAKP